VLRVPDDLHLTAGRRRWPLRDGARLNYTGFIMTKSRINLPGEELIDFCKRHRIRRLSLFGSVLRDDFNDRSDVDVLVEFEPGTRVGLLRLAGMEIELGEMIGRKVDLNTKGFLSRYFRDQVLAEAEVLYDAA
jgi:hypothetical protein